MPASRQRTTISLVLAGLGMVAAALSGGPPWLTVGALVLLGATLVLLVRALSSGRRVDS